MIFYPEHIYHIQYIESYQFMSRYHTKSEDDYLHCRFDATMHWCVIQSAVQQSLAVDVSSLCSGCPTKITLSSPLNDDKSSDFAGGLRAAHRRSVPK